MNMLLDYMQRARKCLDDAGALPVRKMVFPDSVMATFTKEERDEALAYARANGFVIEIERAI